MKVISVNVGKPRTIPHRGRVVQTGIYKAPIEGPVRLTRLRTSGDIQADLSAHGGLDKAVYGYPHEHYAFWAGELGVADGFPCGQFGENLTTEGLLESELFIGDVLRVGEATLQVSEPRQPCFKLAVRMERADFPKRFLQSLRVGFYLRVLEEGFVAAGDSVERLSVDPAGISVREMAQLVHLRRPDPDRARAALAIESLSPNLRRQLERLLSSESEG